MRTQQDEWAYIQAKLDEARDYLKRCEEKLGIDGSVDDSRSASELLDLCEARLQGRVIDGDCSHVEAHGEGAVLSDADRCKIDLDSLAEQLEVHPCSGLKPSP